MTMGEVTQAMQQLKTQQNGDHVWCTSATAALEDHAVRLDRIAVSIMKLRAETADAVGNTTTAATTAQTAATNAQTAIDATQNVVGQIAVQHDEHTKAIRH